MVEILMIVPYNQVESKVYESFKKNTQEDIVFKTTHIYGTKEDIDDYPSSEIIIARGITYASLKEKYPKKYVIEIPITSYDILSAVLECVQKHGAKRIMICARTSSSIEIQSLAQIMGIEIDLFSIENEEDIDRALELGQKNNVDIYVGGLTLTWRCRELGFPYAHIKTSDSTFEIVISEAIRSAQTIILERAKSLSFQMVLNNAHDTIIALDRGGKILGLNNRARNICNIKKQDDVIGKSIENYCNFIEYKEVLARNEETEVFKKIGGILRYVRTTPIVEKGQSTIVMVSIMEADKLQVAETKMRKELGAKGLVARYNFDMILGESEKIKQCIRNAKKVSSTNANVFILGETGTGKELFAQSIHSNSKRKNQPFVAINCATLSESLLESELFGYVEGSFSGAAKGGKMGLFELAHEGTIFLDEIGEITPEMQVKLLRVLEEKEVRRIGDNKVIPIDVRVISATNINIVERIGNKSFRPDLYYRLNLMTLTLPPLRERPEDVSTLCRYFFNIYSDHYNTIIPVLEDDAIEFVENYSWMGNVRELRNFCERLIILNEGELVTQRFIQEIGLGNIPQQEDAKKDEPQESKTDLGEIAPKDLLQILAESRYTKEEIAKAMGISRTTLWRYTKELEKGER